MEECAAVNSVRIISLIAVSALTVPSLCFIAIDSAADLAELIPLVTTDRAVYLVGERMSISVTCYIPMEFTSGKQCFFVVVNSLGDIVYDMSRHYYWVQVPTTLSPPKTFVFSWDQRNDSGVQVPTGEYEIWGYEAGYRMSDPPIAGNSTTVSIVEKYALSFAKGWNLFSLPLLASNYTASSLGLPIGSLVARWNATEASYDTFAPGISPLSDDFALEDFSAFYVYVPSVITVAIFGIQVSSAYSFQLEVPPAGGWVFAGFPETGSIHQVSEILDWTDQPDAVRAVAVLGSTGSYKTWVPHAPPANSFALTAGQGYFIYLRESVTVVYGP
jgi:hypothetical protein